MTERLPPTPDSILDGAGEPRVGAYEGPLLDGSLAARRRVLGPLSAFVKEKRWMYAAIAKPDFWVCFAIADLGYTSSAFVYAADPTKGIAIDIVKLGLPKLSARVLDRPEAGCDARFRTAGLAMHMKRPEGSSVYDVAIDAPKFSLSARLDVTGAPPGLVAIAKPPGGDANVTEKRVGLSVTGSVDIAGARTDLAGASAGFDYTHGFLPRHTEWHWAFLLGETPAGERFGMNLVEGFNGQPECGVFLGDRVYSVGEGRFVFNPEKPLDKWVVTTTCGAVDLAFTPVGMHEDRQNLGLVRSKFVQPVGMFEGTIRAGDRVIEVRAPGVVEDQDMVW